MGRKLLLEKCLIFVSYLFRIHTGDISHFSENHTFKRIHMYLFPKKKYSQTTQFISISHYTLKLLRQVFLDLSSDLS